MKTYLKIMIYLVSRVVFPCKVFCWTSFDNEGSKRWVEDGSSELNYKPSRRYSCGICHLAALFKSGAGSSWISDPKAGLSALRR